LRSAVLAAVAIVSVTNATRKVKATVVRSPARTRRHAVHGLEVCRQIKRESPDVRVVVFLAMKRSGHQEAIHRGQSIGFCV
jgi:DNA-binding NarL/FixJ family response regulator